MRTDAPVEDRAPLPQRGGEFARVDRRFGRSLQLGLAFVALITSAAPLLSYRSDVAISRHQLQRRVESEASIAAEFLSLHLEVLGEELRRVAQRPEVDFRDDTTDPEQTLLMLAHHDSVLFSGVALFDPNGRPLRTEPGGLFPSDTQVLSQRWFQRILEGEQATVDALRPGQSTFVVAIPVLRKGKLSGVIAGLIDASDRLLPVLPLPGGDLSVIGAGGDVLFPATPPAWLRRPDITSQLAELRNHPEALDWTGPQRLASARPVGRTGLWLVLVADMTPSLAGLRRRYLWQLGITGGLQLITIILVSLYLRATYRRFLQLDLSVAEQQKLSALGTAAALIAHEVKNSLNGLRAATATLSAEGNASLGVGVIQGQVDRLGHLARSLLSFGNPTAPRMATVRVDETVTQAVDGLRAHPEWPEVEVGLSLESPLSAWADPFLLVTALDNLVRNAIEATVAAKDMGRLSDRRIHVAARKEGEGVAVSVEDHAGGPPADFEQRGFTPFVTSKPRGIGLGLAMAQRAAEQQGGSIGFERTADGSRFTVRLRVPPDMR